MEAVVDANTILISGERHVFESEETARRRALFINEGLSYVGTPFINCADIKGRNGGIDCAMLLVRSAVDTGLLPAFDPRPYPPQWFLHRSDERFVEWIEQKLGAKETDQPRIGDVIVFRFGHTFAHGTILVNSREVLHAWFSAGMCLVTPIETPMLDLVHWRTISDVKRPRRTFTLWGD